MVEYTMMKQKKKLVVSGYHRLYFRTAERGRDSLQSVWPYLVSVMFMSAKLETATTNGRDRKPLDGISNQNFRGLTGDDTLFISHPHKTTCQPPARRQSTRLGWIWPLPSQNGGCSC